MYQTLICIFDTFTDRQLNTKTSRQTKPQIKRQIDRLIDICIDRRVDAHARHAKTLCERARSRKSRLENDLCPERLSIFFCFTWIHSIYYLLVFFGFVLFFILILNVLSRSWQSNAFSMVIFFSQLKSFHIFDVFSYNRKAGKKR